MKKISYILAIAFVSLGTPFITGCGSETTEETAHDHEGYICPMQCEGSESETEGECPVCGMDLIEISELE